jgi:NADPH2:quinone reductase
MKAIRVREFGGPEKLVVEEVPDLRPGAGEVVVRIHAAGVNPVEAYIRTGTYAMKPALPYTPGMDGAGEVLAVGEGVKTVKPGDRVYVAGSLSGTYAQQSLSREAQVHPLPKQVTFQQGAAVGVPYGTAIRGLFQRAHALPGESLLVHGASGGVGIAGVQLARAHGMLVIGTASSDKGRQLVRDCGAHFAFDHNAPDLAEQVSKATGGRGVNVILEMLANKNLSKDLSMLSQRGRVVVIGNRGSIEINPRDAMARDAAILGMVLFNTPEAELASIHAGLGAALEFGVARPVIGKEFPLAEASRAHEAVLQPGSYGKIVLIC